MLCTIVPKNETLLHEPNTQPRAMIVINMAINMALLFVLFFIYIASLFALAKFCCTCFFLSKYHRPVLWRICGSHKSKCGNRKRICGSHNQKSGSQSPPTNNPSYLYQPCDNMRSPKLLWMTRMECNFGRRLLVSVLLGSIIGFERREADRPAGIRTMSLVSLGACLFSVNSAFAFVDGPMNWDASRISAAIPSGVGFLGAGLIFKEAQKDKKTGDSTHVVHGLTTAASLWIVRFVLREKKSIDGVILHLAHVISFFCLLNVSAITLIVDDPVCCSWSRLCRTAVFFGHFHSRADSGSLTVWPAAANI